jgi:hypothetical protein
MGRTTAMVSGDSANDTLTAHIVALERGFLDAFVKGNVVET